MGTYIDNGVPYGAQAVTIGSASVILESVDVKEPSTAIERFDQLGAPSGAVYISGFDNGTAVAQLAATTTTPMTVGVTFTLVRNNGTTSGWVVTESGESQAQFGARKQSISIRRRYGS